MLINKQKINKFRKKYIINILIKLLKKIPFIVIYYNKNNVDIFNDRKIQLSFNFFNIKIKNKILNKLFKIFYFKIFKNNLFKNDTQLLYSLKKNNLLQFLLYLNKNSDNLYYIIYNNFFLNPSRTLLLVSFGNLCKIKNNIIYILKKNNRKQINIIKQGNNKVLKLLSYKVNK